MAGLALLVALLAALVAPAGTEGDRKVSLEFNPGWNGSSVNVLHVRAEGPGDTLHFVWGSLGAPSVLLVASRSPQSRLDIDWPRLLSPSPEGALRILPPGSVSYAGAVVFTRLLEEKAPGEGFFPPYDLSGFSWEDSNATLEPRALRGQLRGAPEHDPGGAFSNGSIAFQVTAFPSLGRADVPPGLPRVPGSCGLELLLQGVAPRGNSSRFLLELAALEAPGAARALRPRRDLDDEFAPGVFQTLSLVAESRPNGSESQSIGSESHSNGSESRSKGSVSPPGTVLSFLQWRAVAYGSSSPRRQDGMRCGAGGLREGLWAPQPLPTLARAYFGAGPGTPLGFSALNVSFGAGAGDGDVYRERRFLRWSVLVGFGEPPRDSFSPLIISIMAVALGTPLVLLLGGSGLVLLARRRRYSEYEPIN
ncbi:glycosylated lysosomal membrane protein isoform X3 [Myiozetetes cayanensis]|uniref:glycosylated lysosomal membrane protein isoform X2 n=1 Tax=Myiozetetes cayanensis TaxID=478635 RepID=UPI0021606051|nr:glycosylated lysosomal membrane protein isoform X2 [Myiozetetes cayanensis]XP_050162246.1 glycosylated lysosomal membrane protein isoform X3 [Myiozetetes cayanensis]